MRQWGEGAIAVATLSGGLPGTFSQVSQGLQELGFLDELLQHDYQFADILGERYTVKTIPLAAFTHTPASYQTAVFGIVLANGSSGPGLVSQYKSLGAPQILEISPTGLNRWKLSGVGGPTFIEQVDADRIQGFFRAHRDDWNPFELARARARQPLDPVQYDFFDQLLLPLLDHEVQERLDILLRQTIAASIGEYEQRGRFSPSLYPLLFRLIFRLLAAKILADRRHPGNWMQDDPELVVRTVERFYFPGAVREPVLLDRATQVAAWERIRSAFHFQNVSVDALAYVYETTLVSNETRRNLGTHGTPPQIAEFVVRHLPFEDLPEGQRTVFEPFAGHAVFLTAAMRRLRELLRPEQTSEQRHAYFVDMLSGIEIDPFAREVGRLCLMLADYPNPDGWRLYQGDVFSDVLLRQNLDRSSIVLCNPPFESFSPDERTQYGRLASFLKPSEILSRVMQAPPAMLGFVLPRVAITAGGYRKVREQIADRYGSIEVVALPDNVFQHSEAESVLLMASRRRENRVRLMAGEVHRSDLVNFYRTHQLSYQATAVDLQPLSLAKTPWILPLRPVWEATAHLPKLQEIAEVHRGIEYNQPFNNNLRRFVSGQPATGFQPGLAHAKGIDPYLVRTTTFLNVEEKNMRGRAYRRLWQLPKVVANARRRTRGHWKLTASADYRGLVCYQNLHGVWPKDGLEPEVIAAILNGPLANAFVASHDAQRDILVGTIENIPIPTLSGVTRRLITKLVNDYVQLFSDNDQLGVHLQDRARRVLGAIDAEVLKAYDLHPRLERLLLDYFSGERRPGPVEFTEYFPSWFTPHLSWGDYLAGVVNRASAAATLERLTPLDDPLITAALAALDESASSA